MDYQWMGEPGNEDWDGNPYADRDEEGERRRRERRHRQLEAMRRSKRRQKQMRRILGIALPAVGVILVFFLVRGFGNKDTQDKIPEKVIENTAENTAENIPDASVQSQSTEAEAVPADSTVYTAETTENTKDPGEKVNSNYAILIDLDSAEILSQRNSTSRMIPASMTKVLTALVAAEHITDWEDTFTITSDIIDYSFVNGCSNAGFEKDETVTVRDLFYGTVLPSGGEAALGLATYVAGSQEAFVEMMNDKLEELGLADTAHFTNCVGLHEENHYCTVYDMAMIMKAAMDNEICREVLSAHTYNTSITEEHPEGLLLSNWFLRKIEDKDAGGEVIGGKTGYVAESGNCAVSLAKDKNGKEYICVTGDAYSGWRCIYDHVELYKKYMM